MDIAISCEWVSKRRRRRRSGEERMGGSKGRWTLR